MKRYTTESLQSKRPTKALHPTAYSFISFARFSLWSLRFRWRVGITPQDPDWSVAYGAYVALRHLLPMMGPAQENRYFTAHREAESQPIYRRWSAELQGQHA